VYTSANQWLTMNSGAGSFAFTDFGVNASTQVSDRFRVGAQFYDHNIGNLGNWHPALDWTFADYRLRPWFAAARSRRSSALYNDTQDYEFLTPFALLPQSVYPLDTHDANIAHEGGDLYGDVSVSRHSGTFSHVVYGGAGRDSL
jgi:hypothetical protein